jgi:hypothetical protein
MGVHDPRTAAMHRAAHLPRVQAPAEQAGGGGARAGLVGVAREQLHALTEVIAHEREQVLHGALLAAREAIAMMQKEDH